MDSVLTEADHAAMQASALRDLGRLVGVQGAFALLAALVCWMGFGWQAGASALAGGLAYYLPNLLFALRLMLGLAAARPLSPFGFLLGELGKVGAAVALLALAGYMWRDWLVWPAMLFGLVCVLKGYVLVMLLGKRQMVSKSEFSELATEEQGQHGSRR